jgi:stearoyl-CoA desaturase (delta-9 desaturase)
VIRSRCWTEARQQSPPLLEELPVSSIQNPVPGLVGPSSAPGGVVEPKAVLATAAADAAMLDALDVVDLRDPASAPAVDGDAVPEARRADAPAPGVQSASVHRAGPLARVMTVVAVVVPPFALVAAMVLAWGGWLHAIDLVLLGVLYVLTAAGITIGYHRLYTHKSFVARGPVAAFFAILGGMALQGPLIWWCATHRRHHQHSDHDHDPHSPHAGRRPGVVGAVRAFMHAHVGWLFGPLEQDARRYVPDLLADPVAVRINALFPLWAVLGFVLPAAIGGLATMSWMGALTGFLWGGLVRVLLVHHVTWSVNSVCHIWGRQDYHSGDESRNNALMGILALGEGWHNNHHAFPASARHGLKWWQFDASWIAIRTLERLGLASKVRLPAPERLERRSTRNRG